MGQLTNRFRSGCTDPLTPTSASRKSTCHRHRAQINRNTRIGKFPSSSSKSGLALHASVLNGKIHDSLRLQVYSEALADVCVRILACRRAITWTLTSLRITLLNQTPSEQLRISNGTVFCIPISRTHSFRPPCKWKSYWVAHSQNHHRHINQIC